VIRDTATPRGVEKYWGKRMRAFNKTLEEEKYQ
jgi:hypothetical protein